MIWFQNNDVMRLTAGASFLLNMEFLGSFWSSANDHLRHTCQDEWITIYCGCSSYSPTENKTNISTALPDENWNLAFCPSNIWLTVVGHSVVSLPLQPSTLVGSYSMRKLITSVFAKFASAWVRGVQPLEGVDVRTDYKHIRMWAFGILHLFFFFLLNRQCSSLAATMLRTIIRMPWVTGSNWPQVPTLWFSIRLRVGC